VSDTPTKRGSSTRTVNGLSLPQVIAMDGPSASGKGTLSRKLAKELGYIYVDSGAMYRTLAWHCLQREVPIPAAEQLNATTEKPIIAALRRWKAELKLVNGALWLHVDGYFPEKEIRTDRVERAVPVIAQIGKVRDWMVARQRDCMQFGPLVMEGRDIGTEVFPLAPVKFFLDANPEARAERMQGRGNSAGTERDRLDMNRKKGALIPALDALRVDNTGQTVEETFAVLMAHVRARLRLPAVDEGSAKPATV
jgi:cytidylate kinase